jgi:hypothetical protein
LIFINGIADETLLPVVLWLKYNYLTTGERGRFGALKSDSTHHFFRNACTKSGSLRFSQFSTSIGEKYYEMNSLCNMVNTDLKHISE